VIGVFGAKIRAIIGSDDTGLQKLLSLLMGCAEANGGDNSKSA
jgi:hypothetical protein